jgi:hypothetical protein
MGEIVEEKTREQVLQEIAITEETKILNFITKAELDSIMRNIETVNYAKKLSW